MAYKGMRERERQELIQRSKQLAMMAATIYAGMYQADSNNPFKDEWDQVKNRARQANLAASSICADLKRYGFDF